MLLCLLIAYISPDMASNHEAKQCLSYFFIRYSTAHPQNKIRLQSVGIILVSNFQINGDRPQIFMTALDTMTRLSESLDESQNMTTPERFGEMLLAWSNPQFGLEWVHSTASLDRDWYIQLETKTSRPSRTFMQKSLSTSLSPYMILSVQVDIWLEI